MGRAALASNNIVTANADFSNAVAVSSSNPDANFFYAFTRVAVLPFQPAVKGLLDGFEVDATGRDLWKWTADFQRNLFDQIVLPTNCPSEPVVMGVLTNTVLPQIVGALTNLTHVPPNYSTMIGPELNLTNTHEVTYNAEVVLYQSALQAAQGLILTLNSYNLDANISAIVSNWDAGAFNINTWLGWYPQFGTPTPAAAALLPSAAAAFNTAISEFEDGAEAIYAETRRPLGSSGLTEGMLDFQDALYGPEFVNLKYCCPVTLVVDLTPFFYTGPINIRNLLPQFQLDPVSYFPRAVANSLPDPTLDQMLPDATQQWWIDLGPPYTVLPGDADWQTIPFGAGLDSDAEAMVINGTNVYVGGFFDTAGSSNNYVHGIAVWNGTNWSGLGSGVHGQFYGDVYALAISGTKLYVGGVFTNAGGIPANNIAMWNGSSWSALGSGVGGVTNTYTYFPVYALAVSGTNLYVGGIFTNAGSVAVNNIAVWNGSSWSALGRGVGGTNPYYYCSVNALAVSGTNLYVGGDFTIAGGVVVNNIAAWNGSSWSALGSGVGGPNDYVGAIALNGTNLYVGGSFTNAGSVAANNIAAWNGSSWSALGSGVGGPNDFVGAIALNGTNLYVGGSFTNTGAVPANDIAMWNGSSWSALGSGVGTLRTDAKEAESVAAMAMLETNLLVGGYFGYAGGWKASNIALWNSSAIPAPSAAFFANPPVGIAPLAVTFIDTSSGTVTNWYWNFGDGSSTNVTTASVTHVYPLGTYTVTEIVSGPGGSSASTQMNYIMALTEFANWQWQYFQCTSCPQAQPGADPYGKGMSNTNQYLAGFSPTNSAAYLHIISVAKANGTNVVVTFLGANGDSSYSGGPTSRTNVLEYTTPTANGSYVNSFTNPPVGSVILNAANGLGTVTNMIDFGGATNSPSRYYRVRVLLP
jgi:PKD repeat protein